MDVLVRYSDFSDKIKEATIPITGGSQKIEITQRAISLDVNGQPDEFVDVLKFTFSDDLNFTLTQELSKDELEDYLEVLRRFINQLP